MDETDYLISIYGVGRFEADAEEIEKLTLEQQDEEDEIQQGD